MRASKEVNSLKFFFFFYFNEKQIKIKNYELAFRSILENAHREKKKKKESS
jgi:hypothetical protein